MRGKITQDTDSFSLQKTNNFSSSKMQSFKQILCNISEWYLSTREPCYPHIAHFSTIRTVNKLSWKML